MSGNAFASHASRTRAPPNVPPEKPMPREPSRTFPHDMSLIGRREALQIGFSTAMGIGLNSVVGRSPAGAAGSPGSDRPSARAKSVIIVYQTGGASQIDTLDPKPRAVANIRGEFQPIATRTAG